MVVKVTIAAFKLIIRFSKLISQIKIDEKTDILIYFADLTKFFYIIFFALEKNRFTSKFSVLEVLEKKNAASKRINGFSKLISQNKMHESTDILVYLESLTKFFY